MSKAVLSFGILGCGMIANIHASAINELDNARLIGVADVNEKNAALFAEKQGVKKYSSFKQMLSDDSIDAVCICTPSGFHAENAIAALNSLKHVVLEKPMAFTVSECERIKAACLKNGKSLTVISQLRFSDDVKRVKKAVENGSLGRPVMCSLYMKYWRSPEYYASGKWRGTLALDGGGALMNQGIHGIDLLLYLVGDAKVLSAKCKTAFHSIETEDTAAALLEFENGAIGVVEASTCAYPGFERRIELIGTNGYAVLRENKLESLRIGDDIIVSDNDIASSGSASDPKSINHDAHAAQISAFVRAVLENTLPPIGPDEGMRAVGLIEQIYNHEK